MKIKDGFVMREVAGQAIVIATGEASRDFHGMIKLNTTAADIWKLIADGNGEDVIVKHLTDKYDIDSQTAAKDTAAVLSKLKDSGFIADE